MAESKASVYFPGLNSLRFIAAFLVLVSHVEQFKGFWGYTNYYSHQAIHQIGDLAVTFFFVLSGFLITYLLFKEREQTRDISIRKFYVRRVLRIWPLYYLLVISCLYLLPQLDFLYPLGLKNEVYEAFWAKNVLYFLFLPQVVLFSLPRVLYLEPSWSIGVEEHFYLMWPVLVKYFRDFIRLMFVLLIIIYGLRAFGTFGIRWFDGGPMYEISLFIQQFFYFTRFQLMVIGGIGAYILFNNISGLLIFIYSKYTQWFAYLVLLICLFSGFEIKWVNHEFYGIFFLIVILNIASNKDSILKLEIRVFDYLGRISYGIYMYHEIAIGISIYLLSRVGLSYDDFFHLFPCTSLVLLSRSL
ncbi:MAG: acyltransferase [Cyclobacteriaceae bacterium]|nr:acyltransferase [Cyclobacteriaceae bacterium]